MVKEGGWGSFFVPELTVVKEDSLVLFCKLRTMAMSSSPFLGPSVRLHGTYDI